MLVSFLCSAFALSAVIVWGYFNECLPIDLLSRTDHYALQSLKKGFRPLLETDLPFEPTLKQKDRTQIILSFVTVLSDQQLVTGVAILIAGLASRCRISLYEFNIVTYLAYFAISTHTLSLGVLQSHLFLRKLVRNCRVVFAIGFSVIFVFSFIINTASSHEETTLYLGNELQCLFEASRFGKSIQFDIADSTLIVGFILINHTMAITRLFFDPEIDPTAMAIDFVYTYSLHRFKGFPREDASTIVRKAARKYDAWLRPPLANTKQTRISVWFFFSSYYNSYLASFPPMALEMAYGTTSVILAIWGAGLKSANGLQVLGFGQIVAIVLLSLTFLAAVGVINGKPIWCQNQQLCTDLDP